MYRGVVLLVYIVVNQINGKFYVGQTSKTLDKRWAYHLKSARLGSSAPIHSAIRKYGEQNFSVYRISDAVSPEQLDALEKYFIEKYQSLVPHGYNRSLGGLGFHARHSVAARQKMRDSHLGVPTGRSFWKGKNLTTTAIEKMSAVRKGRKMPLEQRELRRQAEFPQDPVMKKDGLFQYLSDGGPCY